MRLLRRRTVFSRPISPLAARLGRGIFLASWLVSACAPKPDVSSGDLWQYADLRIVETPSANSPDTDLVAAYTRLAGDDLQIRLDLLELAPLPAFDLFLALDTGSGGRTDLPFNGAGDLAWDTLLYLPAQAPTGAFQAGLPGSTLVSDPGLIPRIVRYPWQDMLVVSLNANNLPTSPAGFSLQAFLVSPQDGSVLDSLGPLRSDALPPGRAPVLLAFWNTFPAYTPAQALRRWDGAHTGPYGERHGLHLLIQAARRTRIPVFLLDLKTPAALSALDFIGRLPQIQNLVAQGLIILPDALPGSPGYPYFPSGLPDWAWEQALEDSRVSGLAFGLRGSRLLYAPVIPPGQVPDYRLIFTRLPSKNTASWQGRSLLQVPVSDSDPQMDQDGLSLEMRSELLRNAASANQGRNQALPVFLGGSLPDHPLGDPQAAAAVLGYLAAHPWIQPLGEADLLAVRPVAPAGVLSLPAQAPYSPVLRELPIPTSLQDSPGLAAWQAALSLYAPIPPEPEGLAQLRASYSGQPGLLLAARDWAEEPRSISECSSDPDQDGQPECMQADSEILAVIDPLGGRLVMLFSRTHSGMHQLVAPSSQLIAGLSDSSDWDLAAGEGAEPASLQGAFADSRPPWPLYQVDTFPDGMRFTSPDGRVQKTFRLTPEGLRVDYQALSPVQVEIPIVIDPWQRFQTGWSNSYRAEELEDGHAWQLAGGGRLEVRSDIELQKTAFGDSLPQLSLAEDPNYPYPRGHYQPFPLFLLVASAQDEFFVNFSVIEE